MSRSPLLLITAAAMVLGLVHGASGTGYYEFVTAWGGPGNGEGQFSTPCGVAVDASGNVYVGDSHNCRIQKFRYAGSSRAPSNTVLHTTRSRASGHAPESD